MNIEQEIQNILDRNFTRGDNAKALKELLVLYGAAGGKWRIGLDKAAKYGQDGSVGWVVYYDEFGNVKTK